MITNDNLTDRVRTAGYGLSIGALLAMSVSVIAIAIAVLQTACRPVHADPTLLQKFLSRHICAVRWSQFGLLCVTLLGLLITELADKPEKMTQDPKTHSI